MSNKGVKRGVGMTKPFPSLPSADGARLIFDSAHESGLRWSTSYTVPVRANAGTVDASIPVNNFTNSSAAMITITIPTAGAWDGLMVMVRILDASGVAQTIAWVNTENSGTSAPTTSNGSTTAPLTVGFQYNAATSKWRCIASA